MYIIDLPSNSLTKIEKTSFKALKLEERKHLQEWIAKEPSSLGEDLLIIQKEFDGFSDTRERLDLLALDKDGNLVIIENKLDDSGRDVTWQAIKYASYCSSLTKQTLSISIRNIWGVQPRPKTPCPISLTAAIYRMWKSMSGIVNEYFSLLHTSARR